MKTAKVESKKSLKAAQPRRVAGVPVRSGVKAGRRIDAGNTGSARDFYSGLREHDAGREGGLR
jgi:hypothetical protein